MLMICSRSTAYSPASNLKPLSRAHSPSSRLIRSLTSLNPPNFTFPGLPGPASDPFTPALNPMPMARCIALPDLGEGLHGDDGTLALLLEAGVGLIGGLFIGINGSSWSWSKPISVSASLGWVLVGVTARRARNALEPPLGLD
jgi:hypothetical protein